MSLRSFDTLKALFHFDFPYIHEPNDGLHDEVSGLNTILQNSGSVELAGNETSSKIIPASTGPKFGYRCAYFSDNSLFSVHDNLLALLRARFCRIEFFIKFEGSSSGNILNLSDNEDNSLFQIALAQNVVTISKGSNSFSVQPDTWYHFCIVFSYNNADFFVDGALEISAVLNSLATVSKFSIGGFTGYIDELAFFENTNSPSVPSSPYQGSCLFNNIGGFGNGLLGDVTISANSQVNSYGLIDNVVSNKLVIPSWSNGKYGAPDVGNELLIHVTTKKNNDEALLGKYFFARILSVSGNTYSIDNLPSDFDLSEAVLNYNVQAVKVAEFANLTVDENAMITPTDFNDYGGIVAIRTTGNFTLNGKIITMGYGPYRDDYLQLTHSDLIDRFLINKGGGIFIACGGTFSASANSRIGASWDGALTGGVPVAKKAGGCGGAGYGGAGGSDTDTSAMGGYGGVGGGGGGGDRYNGTNAGMFDTGGLGCNNSEDSYSNGGTQGLTQGGASDTSNHSSGGGGALGCASNLVNNPVRGGYAGACLILIAYTLNADASAISTGGEGGYSTNHASGGGGTGLCYIACSNVR